MSDDCIVRTDGWGGKWPADVMIYDNVFLLNGRYKAANEKADNFKIQGNEIRENIPDSVLLQQAENLPLLWKILDRIRDIRGANGDISISEQPISR